MQPTFQHHIYPCFQVTKVVLQCFQIKYWADYFTEQGKIYKPLAVVLDEETECWPVLPQLKDELNKIKFEYCAVPLPIYINNRFVKPPNVNNAIKGALVELHFELHHFLI
jgi:hypothetical protein